MSAKATMDAGVESRNLLTTPVWTPSGISVPLDHADIDEMRNAADLHRERNDAPTRQPWIAMLASQSWPDEDWLEDFADKVNAKYPRATIIHTGKRAAQASLIARFEFLGHRMIQVKPAYVTWLADTIMCFWGGTKDTVDDVIRKALLTHRPHDDRFYPGLHVYQTVRSRKTKSGGGGQTGKITHKIRHSFDLVTQDEAKKLLRSKGQL